MTRRRNMSTSDVHRAEELADYGDACLNHARDAIEAGSPVGAREWFEAADAAYRAARAITDEPPVETPA